MNVQSIKRTYPATAPAYERVLAAKAGMRAAVNGGDEMGDSEDGAGGCSGGGAAAARLSALRCTDGHAMTSADYHDH